MISPHSPANPPSGHPQEEAREHWIYQSIFLCLLIAMFFFSFSFCLVDIERFSDRYREKQTEGLEWQPGNIISIVLNICLQINVHRTYITCMLKMLCYESVRSCRQHAAFSYFYFLYCRLEIISK